MADTDNKETAETTNPDKQVVTDADWARKEGVWEHLSDDDRARLEGKEPGSDEPKKELPDDNKQVTQETQPPQDATADELKQMREELENIKKRYSASSDEGKRLASEIQQYKAREAHLRSHWDYDSLFDGFQQEPLPEDKPITRRELEQINEQQRWITAKDNFFASDKNSDLNRPGVKEWVERMIFDDSGMEFRYPELGPTDAFARAASAVRNVLAQTKMEGKKETMTTRQEIDKAAVTEGTGAAPEQQPQQEAEEIHEDEFVRMHRAYQQKIRDGTL